MGSAITAKNVRTERLEKCEEFLAKTLDRRKAMRKMMRTYNISERQARRYVTAVRRMWEKEARGDHRRTKRAAIRQGYLAVYQSALEEGDRRNALAALRALADLDGLNEPEQHEHTIQAAPQPQDSDKVIQASQRLKMLNGGKDGTSDRG
jgi:hypothetical protein